ncbi:MAG: hypothetical protein HZB13_03755 [Acidobacteria bacterium]|nr:hypothetical protein [Acidobacteriota bacterium]
MLPQRALIAFAALILPTYLPGQEAALPQFSSGDLMVLREYFGGLPRETLAGIQRLEAQLPPGSGQQIATGARLTATQQRRYLVLPSALEKHLSRLPAGYRRALIGSRVVILDTRNVVRDIYFVPLPRPPAPQVRKTPATD